MGVLQQLIRNSTESVPQMLRVPKFTLTLPIAGVLFTADRQLSSYMRTAQEYALLLFTPRGIFSGDTTRHDRRV